MTEPRMNRHPEFLQETMFAEQGTKVLITNPAADKYLNDGEQSEDSLERTRNQLRKESEHARWLEENM